MPHSRFTLAYLNDTLDKLPICPDKILNVAPLDERWDQFQRSSWSLASPMRGDLKSTTCWNTHLLHSFPFFGYVYCVACFRVIFISIIYISTEGLHKNIPMIQYIKRVTKSTLVSLWSICIIYTAPTSQMLRRTSVSCEENGLND